MEWHIWQLFIICPLIFIGGIVDAIGGGGGLITLPAYMIAGFPVHFAIGTNKVSSSMGTSVALTKFMIDGYMPFKLAVVGIVCALIGSSLGAKTALLIDEKILRVIMLFILPVTAVYVFKSQSLLTEKGDDIINQRVYIVCVFVALTMGFYDGFYGPGAGTFMILLMSGAARLSVQKANGITKAINLATNIAALGVYLYEGRVILPIGLTAGAFSIAGNYIGARFFEKGGSKAVRPVIFIVLSLFFVRVIYDLIF